MKKQNKIITQYKFLRKGNKSENGNITWKLNKWVKVDGELEMCKNGLHSSKEPYDAFTYVQGEILAIVECRGEHLKDDNKYCWREQRVVKTYKWTKKDSLRLAIFSAELCLKNFEKEFPNDRRPWEAIEAAKKVLFRDTPKNWDAAWSAALSARSAAMIDSRSADAAALSAWSAFRTAEAASWYAARCAEFATEAVDMSVKAVARSAEAAALSAGSAESFAWFVAWSAKTATIKKIKKYFRQIVKEKENEKTK